METLRNHRPMQIAPNGETRNRRMEIAGNERVAQQ
jgi:hypothetical protein